MCSYQTLMSLYGDKHMAQAQNNELRFLRGSRFFENRLHFVNITENEQCSWTHFVSPTLEFSLRNFDSCIKIEMLLQCAYIFRYRFSLLFLWPHPNQIIKKNAAIRSCLCELLKEIFLWKNFYNLCESITRSNILWTVNTVSRVINYLHYIHI